MFEYVEGDKMHMVAHETNTFLSDKILIVFKNASDVPKFNC